MAADIDWVSNVFKEFGEVAYVSLPKYKDGRNKGFAFVEFKQPDCAIEAVKVSIEICHPSSHSLPFLCHRHIQQPVPTRLLYKTQGSYAASELSVKSNFIFVIS